MKSYICKKLHISKNSVKHNEMSLKHALLAILSKCSRTGYELSKDVEGSTGFFWNATHQQIYKDLGELQKKGWVQHKDIEQSEKPDKKVYSPTKDGLRELKRWLREPTDPTPVKDAFLIKVFTGELIEPEIILEDLLRQKVIHQSQLEKYLEIEKLHFKNPEKLSKGSQFQYLTLRRGILFEKSWLAWCKEAEEFLKM
jgi:DNA-binding PadR family transcriptional regulator